MTVGVVGGSDLVKITEQLGKTGDEHRRSIIALMMNSATLEVIGLSFFVITSSLKTARLTQKWPPNFLVPYLRCIRKQVM